MLVLCFFQAEDGIRDLVRSRGLGDVYKRQAAQSVAGAIDVFGENMWRGTITLCAEKRSHRRDMRRGLPAENLSLIHISEPTRPY